MSEKATKVIDKMYNNDPFSLWLGIERLEEREGFCKLQNPGSLLYKFHY